MCELTEATAAFLGHLTLLYDKAPTLVAVVLILLTSVPAGALVLNFLNKAANRQHELAILGQTHSNTKKPPKVQSNKVRDKKRGKR